MRLEAVADLALIGFGHVGRRFARLLDERRTRLADEGLAPRIVGIATGRHGCAWNAAGLHADAAIAAERLDTLCDRAPAPGDAFEIIRRLGQSDAEMKVVVETTTLDIEAGQPAINHVRAAIGAGLHVVTANKGPAAFAAESLRAEAEAAGVSFLFEGAVMDGVPIFNLVRETLPAVDVLGFRGVVNSTTNHILSALEDGEPFGPALARMQAEGIAEADATLDVEGWDAAAKTAALANVLMRARLTPHTVDREGISEASGDAARAAKSRGRRLRLVATARRSATGDVKASVRPVELDAADILAGLRGQANALVLETDLLGEVAICQLGGSLTQTAYALLSDLVTIRRRQRARPEADARRSP
jgi:homoserine dehydrogenase